MDVTLSKKVASCRTQAWKVLVNEVIHSWSISWGYWSYFLEDTSCWITLSYKLRTRNFQLKTFLCTRVAPPPLSSMGTVQMPPAQVRSSCKSVQFIFEMLMKLRFHCWVNCAPKLGYFLQNNSAFRRYHAQDPYLLHLCCCFRTAQKAMASGACWCSWDFMIAVYSVYCSILYTLYTAHNYWIILHLGSVWYFCWDLMAQKEVLKKSWADTMTHETLYKFSSAWLITVLHPEKLSKKQPTDATYIPHTTIQNKDLTHGEIDVQKCLQTILALRTCSAQVFIPSVSTEASIFKASASSCTK